MKPEECDKDISAIHYRIKDTLILCHVKTFELIQQRNLTFPLVFCFCCFLSFYSEMENYHYYKYYTKILPTLCVAIHMMVNLEMLSKDHYDKFTYGDYTAIGYIISVPADILFMIDDNSMGFMPGICMLAIQNLWFCLNYFPCLYYHRKQKLTRLQPAWYRMVFIIGATGCGISYLNFEQILKLAEYSPIELVYVFSVTQALMVICQLLRRRLTIRRSFAYTMTGTLMELLSSIIYFNVRAQTSNHWSLRLLWISLHCFEGCQFTVGGGKHSCNEQFIYIWKSIILKEKDDSIRRAEWAQKRAEYQAQQLQVEEQKKKVEELKSKNVEEFSSNDSAPQNVQDDSYENRNEEKVQLLGKKK